MLTFFIQFSNLGPIGDFSAQACGREAIKEFGEMQPGDVKESFAEIEASRRDLGFEPHTSIDEGIPHFVDWYREYHGV